MALTIQRAALPFALEGRPERTVNGGPLPDAGPVAPTEIQAAVLGHGSQRLLLVGADLIWFSDDLAKRLRAELADRLQVPVANIVLAASHSHGTANPDERFDYGTCSPALQSHIADGVRRVCEAALKATPEAVSLAVGRAPAFGLAVHRRKVAFGREKGRIIRRAQNLPNPARKIDEQLTLIVFRNADGQVCLLIPHFACHPVCDPKGQPGADFPGLLRQALQARFPQATCIFLQGFCGDVRPDLRHQPKGFKDQLIEIIVGARFRAPQPGDTAAFANTLAAAAEQAMAAAKPLEPELSAGTARRRLKDITQADTGRDLDLTHWRLGRGLDLLFANGEMLSGLAPDQQTLAVGYANGMVGYLAPRSEYAGGGYEIDGFLRRFGLRQRFDPSFAEFIQSFAR